MVELAGLSNIFSCLILDSSDSSPNSYEFCTFIRFWQDRVTAQAAAVTPDTQYDGRRGCMLGATSNRREYTRANKGEFEWK